jgi:diguanylate cyclase (GGDEF)-like protein/PAS domain S-box-containing protein
VIVAVIVTFLLTLTQVSLAESRQGLWLGVRAELRGAAVVVDWVQPAGSAWDAGIRPGDVVVAIDGLSIAGSPDPLQVPLASTIAVRSEVQNRLIDAPVLQDQAPDSDLLRVSFLLVAVAFVLVGSVVFLIASDTLAASLLLGLSVSAATLLVAGIATVSGASWSLALVYLGLVSFGATIFILFLVFPINRLGSRGGRWAVGVVTAAAVILVALYVRVVAVDSSAYAVVQPLCALFLLAALASTAGLVVLALIRRSPERHAARRALWLVALGTVAGIGPFGVLYLGPSLLGLPHASPSIAILSMALLPLGIGAAIVGRQMFGIERFVRRALVALLVWLSLLGVFSSVVDWLTRLYQDLDQPWSGVSMTLLTVAVTAGTFPALQGQLRRACERWLFHDTYDLASTVHRIEVEIVRLAGIEAIARHVLDQLGGTLGLTWAAIVLDDDALNTSPTRLSYQYGDLQTVPTPAALLALGRQTSGSSASQSVGLVANGVTIGVLAVGPKRRDVELTTEDEALISALAPLVATALQSALRERRLEVQLERLTASENRYRRLVEFSPEPIAVDCDGILEYINPAGIRTLGAVRIEELVGRPALNFVDPTFREAARQRVAHAQNSSMHSRPLQEKFVRLDGVGIDVEVVSISTTYESRPAVQTLFRDVTERTQAELLLRHHALHDALTGLPNRRLLHERLDELLGSLADGVSPPALIILDLDGFKNVNDALGHQAGDALLQQLAQRMESVVRDSDTVARLGGDEFAILIHGPTTTSGTATALAQRLLKVVEKPFLLGGSPVSVGASLGIALAEHGMDSNTLLRRADIAMYVAKRGNYGFATYSPADEDRSPDRLALARELRDAIEQGQLVLHYQPKLDLRDGSLVGVEALVRWQHPLRGLVPPDEFIGLAERTGLMEPLSRWVIETALRQCRVWLGEGVSCPIAINLSARSLHDPTLPETLTDLLRVYGVAPDLLKVEITESSLMTDPAQAMQVVERLSLAGIQVSIDDFGTGYSSLSRLRRFAVHELKIDRSFVEHVATDQHDLAIVRSIIDLAHGMGLLAVAEGVEDQASWDLLAELGCDEAQGYHMSRPLSAADLAVWRLSSAARNPRGHLRIA